MFQLISADNDLQDAFCESSRENLKNNIGVATNLLKTLLKYAGRVYIIVDGLDEIDEVERGRLLKCLTDLSKECDELRIFFQL